MKLYCQVNQFGEGSPESIESPADERVAGAQVIVRRSELGAVRLGTGDGVVEDTLAASRFQRVTLEREILVERRNAGIADLHRLLTHLGMQALRRRSGYHPKTRWRAQTPSSRYTRIRRLGRTDGIHQRHVLVVMARSNPSLSITFQPG